MNTTNTNNFDSLVLEYLKKRGFKQSESSFISELYSSGLDHFIFSNNLITDTHNSTTTTAASTSTESCTKIEESFVSLLHFIEDSLDIYKTELESVLYPLFVHIYLYLISHNYLKESKIFFDKYRSEYAQQYPSDMNQLDSISDPLHLNNNQISQLFLSNKYTLLMSSYAFELLLGYIMDNHFITILKLINQYINIKIYSNKSIVALKQESSQLIGITGHTSKELNQINSTEIGGKASEGKASEGGANLEATTTTTTTTTTDSTHYKQLLEKKLAKSDLPHSEIIELYKEYRTSHQQQQSANIPLPPPTNYDIIKEVDQILDLRNRINHNNNATSTTAICYTMHNTYNQMNCMNIRDNRLAIGYDSTIRLFSLDKQQLIRSLKGSTEYTASDFDANQSKECGYEEEGDYSKRLIGHSGPVYAVKMDDSGKYVVSGSEDGSTRIWSMDTLTSLFSYHSNYPVWDVDIAHGHYILTGSHDRCMRLLSVERANYPLRIFSGHLSDVEVVKFHSNYNYAFSGSCDRSLRMWDLYSGRCVRLMNNELAINAIAVGDDKVVTGDDEGVSVWDIQSSRVLFRVRTSSRVYSVDIMNDTIAVGCVDGLSVISASGGGGEGGELVGRYMTKKTPLYYVGFSRRGMIVCGGAYQ